MTDKKCPKGKILNPKTKRCVKMTGKVAKGVVAKSTPKKPLTPKKTPTPAKKTPPLKTSPQKISSPQKDECQKFLSSYNIDNKALLRMCQEAKTSGEKQMLYDVVEQMIKMYGKPTIKDIPPEILAKILEKTSPQKRLVSKQFKEEAPKIDVQKVFQQAKDILRESTIFVEIPDPSRYYGDKWKNKNVYMPIKKEGDKYPKWRYVRESVVKEFIEKFDKVDTPEKLSNLLHSGGYATVRYVYSGVTVLQNDILVFEARIFEDDKLSITLQLNITITKFSNMKPELRAMLVKLYKGKETSVKDFYKSVKQTRERLGLYSIDPF